jgi:hypothetical protein
MQTYVIVYRGDRAGYDVQIKADDGSRHTIVGFKMEADAKAWVEDDKRAALAHM